MNRSWQQNGSKRWWEIEDLQNTNLSVCESEKGDKFMGYYVEIMVTHDA